MKDKEISIDLLKLVGRNIKFRRLAMDMTLFEMALRTKSKDSHLSKIERGLVKKVSLKMIERIAKEGLGCEVIDLFAYDPKMWNKKNIG